MKERLIIGSRGSKLALWQAEWVKEHLGPLRPHTKVLIEIVKTSGDVLNDLPLSEIGGRGVFTKELEEALVDGRIDLAVHSLKDMPTTLPEGLAIAAITEREDPRDALVLRQGLKLEAQSLRSLKAQSVVGTSSPRRLSQLKHLRPDLSVKELRGNVDTRLRKLDAGVYDAVILASAGLRRLGLANRITLSIDIEEMLPAVGQGALAIETRSRDEDIVSLIASLDDTETRAACTAERSLLRALGGGCQLPIAAHAIVENERLRLYALVAEPSGRSMIRESLEGAISQAEQLGEELAIRMRAGGAELLLSGVVPGAC